MNILGQTIREGVCIASRKQDFKYMYNIALAFDP